ncbi:hypothetical protein SJC03_238 [Bacteroides phage SJC03]|nr:hypothetical protein SJC03_238 [Bacteroides phage SJC03]
MKKVNVEIVKETENELPNYATPQSAGCDIRAELSKINQDFFVDTVIDEVDNGVIKSIKIKPGGRCLIPTGLKVAIPDGYEIQVRPRSGLALKKGISLVNCVGTIDQDFREEVNIILINHGKDDFIVNQGERIAQFVLNEVKQISWKEVESLDKTDRNGGFGSTGTK